MDTDLHPGSQREERLDTNAHPELLKQERQVLLHIIRTKMYEKILKKNPLKRSCDKLYPNEENDTDYYLRFKGRYLVEVRPKNIAHLVITNVSTKESSCPLVSDSGEISVTCNNKHVIVGSNTRNGNNHLFKINISDGKVINNFSKQMIGLQDKGSAYKYLAYNPCKRNFISVSKDSLSKWLFCFHDSKTGKVKTHWREEGLLDSDYDISYSPNGSHCIVSNGTDIYIRDGETGEIIQQIPIKDAKITWHPQSYLFIAHSEEKNSVINVQNESIEKEFFNRDSEDGYYQECSLFTANGKYLISLIDKFCVLRTKRPMILIRDGKTFEIIKTIPVTKASAEALSVSYDGKYLVYFDNVAELDCIILYDLENNKEVAKVVVQNPVKYIRWQPRIYQFISVDRNSTELSIWDVDIDSNKLIKAFKNLKNADDWHIGLVADVCDGETEINKIDEETWNVLPSSVQILLKALDSKKTKNK
jgi:hypothetical protein